MALRRLTDRKETRHDLPARQTRMLRLKRAFESPQRSTVIRDDFHAEPDHVGGGRPRCPQCHLHCPGRQFVVAIEEEDARRRSRVDPCPPRLKCRPVVFLSDQTHTWVPPLVVLDHTPGIVGRRIIHTDDLDLGGRLPEATVQRSRDPVLIVENGDHYGHQGGRRRAGSLIGQGGRPVESRQRATALAPGAPTLLMP